MRGVYGTLRCALVPWVSIRPRDVAKRSAMITMAYRG